MIDINECRIGMLAIQGNDLLMKYEVLDADSVYATYSLKNGHQILPIPLSGWWMNKLGFVMDKSGNFWSHKSGWLVLDVMGDYLQYPGGCVPIKFVHQVQNLFFVLTGAEIITQQIIDFDDATSFGW